VRNHVIPVKKTFYTTRRKKKGMKGEPSSQKKKDLLGWSKNTGPGQGNRAVSIRGYIFQKRGGEDRGPRLLSSIRQERGNGGGKRNLKPLQITIAAGTSCCRGDARAQSTTRDKREYIPSILFLHKKRKKKKRGDKRQPTH